MASFNKVMLIGNLTKDPDLRTIPSGINVADLRLAINESYTDKSGQKVEKACFVDVVVWDKQADLCKTYLSKGSPVLVEGKLQMEEWTTKEGGKTEQVAGPGRALPVSRLQTAGSGRGTRHDRTNPPTPGVFRGAALTGGYGHRRRF